MSDVDKYLEGASSQQKAEFERIRQIVQQLAPETSQVISYGIPTFKYKNKPLVYIGIFKDHLSLFPTSGPIEALKDKLADFKLARGTIQFSLQKPIPTGLIEEIVRFRLKEINQLSK